MAGFRRNTRKIPDIVVTDDEGHTFRYMGGPHDNVDVFQNFVRDRPDSGAIFSDGMEGESFSEDDHNREGDVSSDNVFYESALECAMAAEVKPKGRHLPFRMPNFMSVVRRSHDEFMEWEKNCESGVASVSPPVSADERKVDSASPPVSDECDAAEARKNEVDSPDISGAISLKDDEGDEKSEKEPTEVYTDAAMTKDDEGQKSEKAPKRDHPKPDKVEVTPGEPIYCNGFGHSSSESDEEEKREVEPKPSVTKKVKNPPWLASSPPKKGDEKKEVEEGPSGSSEHTRASSPENLRSFYVEPIRLSAAADASPAAAADLNLDVSKGVFHGPAKGSPPPPNSPAVVHSANRGRPCEWPKIHPDSEIAAAAARQLNDRFEMNLVAHRIKQGLPIHPSLIKYIPHLMTMGERTIWYNFGFDPVNLHDEVTKYIQNCHPEEAKECQNALIDWVACLTQENLLALRETMMENWKHDQ